MKICKNKFLKRLIIIITVIYLIINCIAPGQVYANKSQEADGLNWKTIWQGIATGIGLVTAGIITGGVSWGVVAVGAVTCVATGMLYDGLEGESLADIPGNLLKEIVQLMGALGDIVMGAVQSLMLGVNFFDLMISNKDDNLGSGSDGKSDSGSWLYAGEGDVTALQSGNSTSKGDANLILVEREKYEDGLLTKKYKVPNILYSPEKIFSNQIAALDANFINPHTYTSVENDSTQNPKSLAEEISPIVANWYKVLRNIAIVGLLSVLVYIGIRILIGTVSEKAKYKERLFDWFVGLCMVFFMHFIMAGIMMFSEKVIDLIGSTGNPGIVVCVSDGCIFRTSFMGLIRFLAQSNLWKEAAAYNIMYLLLVGITLKYTYIYLKRALYLAFFTVIAPMVALTYPLDKIKDSQSQAFDMWIKEYFINAIIQPVHLLLYTVFVGSSMSLAIANPIYGIVVLLFIPTAEKWIKKMFKIDKAPLTSSTLGDVALLGTMFGMGKNIVGGVANGVKTVGSAVATGRMEALGSGIANSYLGAPYRAVNSVINHFNSNDSDSTNNSGSLDDNSADSRYSITDEDAERIYRASVEANQKESMRKSEEIRSNFAKNSGGENQLDSASIQTEGYNGGDSLPYLDPTVVDREKDQAGPENVAKSEQVRSRLTAGPKEPSKEETDANTASSNAGKVDTTKLSNKTNVADSSDKGSKPTSSNTGGDSSTGASNKEQEKKSQGSEYEQAMMKDRNREKLSKRDEAGEISNFINQGIVGAGGAIIGAAAGTIMAGAMDDSKMMAAGAMGGATVATAIRNLGADIKGAAVNNNIKILVNAGVSNHNVIKNTAQIASQKGWSEDKMKTVAKMVDDITKGQRSMEQVRDELKNAGIDNEQMLKKAMNDINMVLTGVNQAKEKEDNKTDSNVKNWK